MADLYGQSCSFGLPLGKSCPPFSERGFIPCPRPPKPHSIWCAL
jgi:hypothetical protein